MPYAYAIVFVHLYFLQKISICCCYVYHAGCYCFELFTKMPSGVYLSVTKKSFQKYCCRIHACSF